MSSTTPVTPASPPGTVTFQPRPHGTTGTGLDGAVSLIGSDQGLNDRIPGSALSEGMTAADGMNALIVQAIRATGIATDGTITTSDVYNLNAWIRANHLAQWTALHGDDEGDIETGFHRVQNDGSTTRMFGRDAVDTVLDGLYHMGFEIRDGRFVNEDGDRNACVEDVAFWLTEFLKTDLAAGTLANSRVDPQ
ncbi:MAG: hypothetical protein JNM13_07040, partial [Hyphomicrobiaceae bacterium]|nr:hypothetical protein [Hyphomicrobiaceae bacterium]